MRNLPLAATAPVLIERNRGLETELSHVRKRLAEANKIAALIRSSRNLEAQIAGLHASVGQVQETLFQARAALTTVLGRTQRIDAHVVYLEDEIAKDIFS